MLRRADGLSVGTASQINGQPSFQLRWPCVRNVKSTAASLKVPTSGLRRGIECAIVEAHGGDGVSEHSARYAAVHSSGVHAADAHQRPLPVCIADRQHSLITLAANSRSEPDVLLCSSVSHHSDALQSCFTSDFLPLMHRLVGYAFYCHCLWLPLCSKPNRWSACTGWVSQPGRDSTLGRSLGYGLSLHRKKRRGPEPLRFCATIGTAQLPTSADHDDAGVAAGNAEAFDDDLLRESLPSRRPATCNARW